MEDIKKFDSYEDVRPGDCLIAFTYDNIFALKEIIEKTMQKKKRKGKSGIVEKVFPIIGSMPAEVKIEIINQFNSNTDKSCIVATDVIGMGMNLNINRIVFSKTEKSIGAKSIPLTQTQIKQIAGRAGRGDITGYVNAFNKKDWAKIMNALKSPDIESNEKVTLLPPKEILQEYKDNLFLKTGKKYKYEDLINLYFSIIINLNIKY